MAAQFHEVPVVPHSLRPAETYAQLCQALQALQATATAVFDMVENRVESERGRLRAISSRIRSAEAKIASLAGSNKAITIYSSAKYPPQHNIDYEPIFGIRTPQTAGPQSNLPGAIPFTGDSRDRPQGSEEALELFRFFSAAAYQAPSAPQELDHSQLPPDLRSTANLLLFDSTESILEKPSAPQSGRSQHAPAKRRPKGEEAKPRASPSKPPRSIIQGDVLAVDESEQFAFRPTLEAVPALDLPPVLPDLPMIADISWTGEQAAGVADHRDGVPSRKTQPTTGSVPTSSGTHSPSPSISDHRAPLETPRLSRAPSADVSTAAASSAPPPFLSPPVAPVTAAAASAQQGLATEKEGSSKGPIGDAPTGAQRSLSPPPVPPPPPPPPNRSPSPPLPAVAGDTARQALLASIRNPGVQLRKVSDERSRTPSPRKEMMAALKDTPSSEGAMSRGRSASSPPPAGDMFAEMASQLMSRRLSMKGALASGAKEVENTTTEPAPRFASPPRETQSPKQPLPVKAPALAALVAQRNMKKPVESDDDDEWDD